MLGKFLLILAAARWAAPPEPEPSLRGIFEAQLDSRRLGALGKDGRAPSLAGLVAAMSTGKGSQRERAKAALDARRAGAEAPAAPAEIARGCCR